MKDATLRYIGIRLGLVILLVIVGNLALFGLLYADTFAPLSLPYSENFDQFQRLVYRQFGGKWDVQNGALLQSGRLGFVLDASTINPLIGIPLTAFVAMVASIATVSLLKKTPILQRPFGKSGLS